MAEKKHKPEIRFKGFSDDWEESDLGKIVKLSSSKRVHFEDYVESGIPFFRGLEISKLGSSSKLRDVLYISEDHYIKLKEKYGVPQVGDILITAVGTLGNTFLVRDNTPFYFKDGNLICLSDIQINSDYLEIFIGDGVGKKRVLDSAVGSNQKALTMVKLQNIEVSFPSKEEQSQIGNFFKLLDHLITLHQRKYDKLVTVKKAMLEKMFPQNGADVPEIRFKGFTEAWEERKFGEVATETFGGGTPKTTIEKFWSGDIPWIQSSDLTDGNMSNVFPRKYISNVGLINSATKLVPGNSIAIVTRVGVGKLAILPYSYATSQDFLSLSKLNIDVWFAVYAIYKKLQRELNAVQGTSIKGITKEELLSKSIFVPNSEEEQSKIGEYFKNIDHLITLQQRELEKLKNIKKACLEKMFV